MILKLKHPVIHIETYSFGQRKIEVKCSCLLGQDHSREEWSSAFAAVRG